MTPEKNQVPAPPVRPQAVAFQRWQRTSPFIPHSWGDHEATFNAGFEAGVRHVFDQLANQILGK